MNIDADKKLTNYLIVMAIVGLIPFSSVLAQDEGSFLAQDDGNSLDQKDLPILPIEKKMVILAEGMDFQMAPFDPNRHFDPEKEMPTWSGTSIRNNKIEWVQTPTDLTVTDDSMLGVENKGSDEGHGLGMIQYREKIERPTNFYTVVGILCWDGVPFCIFKQERQEDSEEFHVYYELDFDGSNVTVEVIQQESGTAAENVRAIFAISRSRGPKLIKIAFHARSR